MNQNIEDIALTNLGGQWESVLKRVNTSAFWFLFSFLIFSIGTLFIEPSGINIRFAIMAREISECGLGVFPTVNHSPYPDYFSFWTMLSWITTLGGQKFLIHCAWFVMLPTILSGACTVAMTFRIAERFKAGSGLYAQLFLLLMMEFIRNAMSFGLDVGVAFFTALMLDYFLAEKCRLKTVILFLISATACFWIRGPLGLLVFGMITGCFLLFSGRWLDVVIYGFCGFLIMSCNVAVSHWLIYRQGGEELWNQLMFCQFGSRIDKGGRVEYFVKSLCSLLPVSQISLLSVCICFRLNWRKWLPMTAAFVIPFSLMAIPGGRHMRYALAVLPVLAVLGAAGFAVFMESRFERNVTAVFRHISVILIWLVPVTSVIFSVILIIFRHPMIALSPAIAAVIGFFIAYKIKRFQPFIQKEHLPVLLTSLVMFLCMSVLPITEIRENSAEFISQTDKVSVNTVYLFDTFFDHEDLKYVFHTRYPEKIRYVYSGKIPACVDYDTILPSFLHSFRRYLPENGKTRHYYEKMFPYMDHKKFAGELREGDAIVIKKETERKLRDFLDKNGFYPEIVIEGDLGHREFMFMRVKKGAPSK